MSSFTLFAEGGKPVAHIEQKRKRFTVVNPAARSVEQCLRDELAACHATIKELQEINSDLQERFFMQAELISKLSSERQIIKPPLTMNSFHPLTTNKEN